MNIYIYDSDLNLLSIVDTFNSLIWNRKYNKNGNFELYVPLTKGNIEYLKIGNVIRKENDLECALIEGKEITLDNTGTEQIKIYGSFINVYLGYRLVVETRYFTGKAEKLIYNIVKTNALSTGAREIPLLTVPTIEKGFTESVDYQSTFGNLLEEIEKICNTVEFGFKSTIDIQNKKLLFEVYKGTDRSTSQSIIAPCIFSRQYENILSQTYTENQQDIKNIAVIQGEGEGDSRKTVYMDWKDIGGLERREFYVDARDLKQTVDNVTMSDNAYENLLMQRGKEKLAEHKEIKTFECSINTLGNNQYKIDYDLGDIITFVDDLLNIKMDTRITEIQEIYENGKLEINPTFGNSIPTVYDKLKKI